MLLLRNFKFNIFFILIFLILFYFFLPVSFKEDKKIYIPRGFSRWETAKLLREEKLIRSASLFYVISLISNKNIKSGEYYFTSPQYLWGVIEKINEGKIFLYKITIPEGFTAQQIAERLENQEIISSDEFLKIVNSSNLYKEFRIIPKGKLEGFLFPDTYYFPKDMEEKEIIKVMLSRFEEIAPSDIEERANKLGLTVKEVITLASLIEKEAKKEQERKLIAGVLYNRLKKGMKLQSCATVQYALGKHKNRLLYEDLKIDSPYNTYLHYGLPPTPICNPGLASIESALNPAKTDYLYFVVKPDGSHFFSKTYQEHLQAKKI